MKEETDGGEENRDRQGSSSRWLSFSLAGSLVSSRSLQEGKKEEVEERKK